MNKSGKLSDIIPENPSTWENKLFLTMDIDWAHDDILADSIDLLDSVDVQATWFVTHETPLLDRLRSNPNYELGIHPNFNWLLNGDLRNGANASEVVARLHKIIPEARCVRCHSMAQSSILLQVFADAGLICDANHFIPVSSGIPLKPWRLWNGMIRVPYNWEDDIACAYKEKEMPTPGISETIKMSGFHVFDFHPIHVFLNTEIMKRYELTRHLHHLPEQLRMHRNSGTGARTWLMELLSYMVE